MTDLFDLFDLGEAKRVRWRVGAAEAADTLLGLDGHVGELRRDAEGWWTVWRDGREQRGLGAHRTQLEAAKAVLDHDWSGVEARPARVRPTAERWTDPATGEWDGRSVLLTTSEPVFDGHATTWVVDGTAGDWDSAIPQALQTVELSSEIERVMARGGER